MGDGQWEMGNGQWAMGNEQWAMGNEQWAMGYGGMKVEQRKAISLPTSNCQPAKLEKVICFTLSKDTKFEM